MTQPNDSSTMKDLFGDDDSDTEAVAPPQPTPVPPVPSAAPATTDLKELFGSDDEDDGDADADADDTANVTTEASADPYRARAAISDLEQQLAGFEEDETSALDDAAATQPSTDAAQPTDDVGTGAEESQERKREKALAKRKANIGRDADADAASAQRDGDGSPSASPTAKRSSRASPIRAPTVIPASGPALGLRAQPIARVVEGKALQLVRLPNVIGVSSKPFSADTWVEQVMQPEESKEAKDDEAGQGARDKKKAVSLMVENVIRWREVVDPDGGRRRESNARLVRWSDGTSSLMVGAECFDVVQSTTDPHRNFLYAQHDAFPEEEEDDGPSSLPLLTSLGAFSAHVKFKVTGIDSESHRKLKDVLFETHTKKARIVMDFSEVDPDKLRAEEEKEQRKREALERRKRSQLERGSGGGRGARMVWGRDKELDAEFLEEGDEEEYGSARRRRGDEDEGDVKRLNRAKDADLDDVVVNDEDDEEEVADDGDDDDEDDADAPRPRTSRPPPSDQGVEETVGKGADDADDELVLQRGGANKKRRVLADDEESE